MRTPLAVVVAAALTSCASAEQPRPLSAKEIKRDRDHAICSAQAAQARAGVSPPPSAGGDVIINSPTIALEAPRRDGVYIPDLAPAQDASVGINIQRRAEADQQHRNDRAEIYETTLAACMRQRGYRLRGE